jgi:hypothetical protein
MSKARFTLNMVAVAIFTLAVASIANAQATRTWVSGVGDDVNPCSRTAPCKTFAGAISKTANNGEIDALDPGGFGAVTITKNITIDGTNGAGFGSILASLVNGVNVNDSATATPNTIIVTLRRLSIQGAGNGTNGIRFVSGKSLTVEDCFISGFRGGTGHGIDMTTAAAASNAQLTVRNTSIHDNLGSGININATGAGSATAILDRVRMHRSANGLTTAGGTVRVTISNSSIQLMSGPGNGVNLSGGSPIVHIEHSDLSHNTTGIAATVGQARISDVYITNCATSITTPANVRSWGDNKIVDNGTNNQAAGAGLTKQ